MPWAGDTLYANEDARTCESSGQTKALKQETREAIDRARDTLAQLELDAYYKRVIINT